MVDLRALGVILEVKFRGLRRELSSCMISAMTAQKMHLVSKVCPSKPVGGEGESQEEEEKEEEEEDGGGEAKNQVCCCLRIKCIGFLGLW